MGSPFRLTDRFARLEAKMAQPCFGTSTKASGFTRWRPRTSSTRSCFRPTATGCALPPARLLKFGIWGQRSSSRPLKFPSTHPARAAISTASRSAGARTDPTYTQATPTTSSGCVRQHLSVRLQGDCRYTVGGRRGWVHVIESFCFYLKKKNNQKEKKKKKKKKKS